MEFYAIVREQKGAIPLGKISNVLLLPHVGKKVKVTIEVHQ